MPGRKGAIHLFRFAGVDVCLHWWWFLIAFYEIQGGLGRYSSVVWNIAEYLTLFLIVLMHEYGHALACRSVGGIADRIVLWPLGGVAYVNPPPRPGANLWSIVAGPLVNVVLAPVIYGIGILGRNTGFWAANPNAHELARSILWIDLGLLIFNILPVYPLDGGQILRSLLWFVMGRARSLMVATVIGFMGAIGLIGLALWQQSVWLGLVAVYLVANCWSGWKQARALGRLAKLPRRVEYQCPKCKNPPLLGEFWKCTQCGQAFDTFVHQATCPSCRSRFPETHCLECGQTSPITEWTGGGTTIPGSATYSHGEDSARLSPSLSPPDRR
jgi:Zn-dependent protease